MPQRTTPLKVRWAAAVLTAVTVLPIALPLGHAADASAERSGLETRGTSADEPPTPVVPSEPAPPPPGPSATIPSAADRDGDGVANAADVCPSSPGDERNGCPSPLDADVRGRWRANSLYSQLVFLTVLAPTGSRVSVRCSAARTVCGFSTRTIYRTTKRLTGLTRYFKGRRIFPAGTTITVRVTRPLQIGLYERVTTRRGRRLPKVINRCIYDGTAVLPCRD